MHDFEPHHLTSMPVCLSVSSMDSTGGAMAQADLKTFTALGTYGAAVVTGLVARSFTATYDEISINESFVHEQLMAVDESLDIAAVKIGHCPSAGIIRTVGRWLRQHKGKAVVVDPVMVDRAGIPLQQPEVISALQQELLPLATVITPNRFEAAQLIGSDEVLTRDDMEDAARRLFATYGCPTVVSGGGLGDQNIDVFCGLDGVGDFSAPRVGRQDRRRSFGIGDTYSASICALLARGNDLRESIMAAKSYVRALLADSPLVTKEEQGSNPISHCIVVDSLAQADGMGVTATGLHRALDRGV